MILFSRKISASFCPLIRWNWKRVLFQINNWGKEAFIQSVYSVWNLRGALIGKTRWKQYLEFCESDLLLVAAMMISFILKIQPCLRKDLPRQVSGVSSRYSLKPFSYFRRVCVGACLIITKAPSLIANHLSSDVSLICFWGFYAIPIILTTGKNSKQQSYHSVIFMSWHEAFFRYNDSVLKMRRSKLKQRELSLFCLTSRTFLWTLALM